MVTSNLVPMSGGGSPEFGAIHLDLAQGSAIPLRSLETARSLQRRRNYRENEATYPETAQRSRR